MVFQLGRWEDSEVLRVKVDLARGAEELSCDLRRSFGACIGVNVRVSPTSSHIKVINIQHKPNKIVLLNGNGNSCNGSTRTVAVIISIATKQIKVAGLWLITAALLKDNSSAM